MRDLPEGCKGSNAGGVFFCPKCGADKPTECVILNPDAPDNQPEPKADTDGNEKQSG